ncbi:hypothetical protein ACWEIJ_37110 [Lentzea sp. NPDC004789]
MSHRSGVEAGRTTLRSAGAARLRLRAETTEPQGPDDLAYMWVELADEDDGVDFGTDDDIVVELSGPGTLAAFGSAAPSTTETYTDNVRSTYRGRAIAIIRGTDHSGEVDIRATSKRHGEASPTLTSTGAEHTATGGVAHSRSDS